jgi:hypothetical protein
MEGEDQGNAGQTYGLLDLAQQYQRALTEHPNLPAEFIPLVQEAESDEDVWRGVTQGKQRRDPFWTD